jgi:hypothetical protein
MIRREEGVGKKQVQVLWRERDYVGLLCTTSVHTVKSLVAAIGIGIGIGIDVTLRLCHCRDSKSQLYHKEITILENFGQVVKEKDGFYQMK